MKPINYILILLTFILFISCKAVKYTYTDKTGTVHKYKSFTMVGDKHDKKNKTTMSIGKFNKNDINKYYDANDSMEIQEITVEDLKTQFKDYDYTLISVWYPCSGSMMYDIKQFFDLADTLSSVASSPDRMAYVFAGLSYKFYFHDLFMKRFDYHLQSYVIPTSYHEKAFMKQLIFLRELNTKFYDEYNDDVFLYTVLVLDNNGEVIKMIDYEITEEGKKVMKDFKAIRDELLELVK